MFKVAGQAHNGMLFTSPFPRANETDNNLVKIVLETAKFRPLTLKYYLKHGYIRCGGQHYGTVETVCFEKHLEQT